MRKIEQTFEFQIRKHKDGALYECDVYFDIVEPSWIKTTLRDKVLAPLRDVKVKPMPENATAEQAKEIAVEADEAIKKANDESAVILKEMLVPKFSSKNKDMKIDEVLEVFNTYPIILNKFLLKWHEVCLKQTFRGLELVKDS